MVQLGFLRQDTPAHLTMMATLSPSGESGLLTATIENAYGVHMADFRKSWKVARDQAGLPDWARDVAQHFIYGRPHDLPTVAYVAMDRHMPRLDAVGRAVRRPT